MRKCSKEPAHEDYQVFQLRESAIEDEILDTQTNQLLVSNDSNDSRKIPPYHGVDENEYGTAAKESPVRVMG